MGCDHTEETWCQRDTEALSECIKALSEGDLARALLAVEGASLTKSQEVTTQLQVLAARVRAQRAQTAIEIFEAMRASIFVGRGIRGNKDDYYGHYNSHISAVLNGGAGQPILVTAVWIIVGQQAGHLVHGIGLPGHFVARIGGEQGVFVDPFAGTQISMDRCKHIARVATGQDKLNPAWFEPVSQQALIERVLRNLINASQIKGNLDVIRSYVDGLDTIDSEMKQRVRDELVNLYNEANAV